MPSFTVNPLDLMGYCYLMTSQRWTDPCYLSLLKEYWEANMNRQIPGLTIKAGIHLKPDYNQLLVDVFILLESVRGVLTPHLFMNREPLPTLPETMLVSASPEEWSDPQKFAKIKFGKYTCSLPDQQILKIMPLVLMIIIHTAKRMNDGFKGSLVPDRTVLVNEQSPWFPYTFCLAEHLAPGKVHPDFNLSKPEIAKDILDKPISSEDPAKWGSSIEPFLQVFLAEIKASGFFPLDMPFNDVLRYATDMGKCILGSTGLHKDYFDSVKTLVRDGFIDPALPAPYLTPKGLFLRDLLWEARPLNIKLFITIPSSPIGVGARIKLGDVSQIGGNVAQR
nr:hypothetical protein [Candidatus Sigynarchaeota archaeon]